MQVIKSAEATLFWNRCAKGVRNAVNIFQNKTQTTDRKGNGDK